ncbi:MULTISPECIES: hypothetical protein [unclassified Bradyrhizobium]|uniref:hypothetical protein n=1 Tax=unclassified Bradyrhizobium TaxID=2631580 RepID=UPI0024791209|nr:MULTISPECIES: hypothetical protein [unclassified Bradyrhizobium]WGS19357.1 hypothetical protein MTX22_33950 [Bradyrhizobium sp. ISRA463]WGS26193.1 hypothetical protein MTX19_31465 [Bradyrhizobium sp. ISRA464]
MAYEKIQCRFVSFSKADPASMGACTSAAIDVDMTDDRTGKAGSIILDGKFSLAPRALLRTTPPNLEPVCDLKGGTGWTLTQ